MDTYTYMHIHLFIYFICGLIYHYLVIYKEVDCVEITQSTPEIAMQVLPLIVSKITAEHNAISIFIFPDLSGHPDSSSDHMDFRSRP